MLLNNKWVNNKIKGEIRRYLEVIKEHVQRTHGQSQRGVGLRVGGGGGWSRGEW